MDKGINNVLSAIQIAYDSLFDAEKKVADFVLKYPEEVINMGITELSEKSNVSDATTVRFCKKIGFNGYQHFKMTLAKKFVSPENVITPTVDLSNIKGSIESIMSYKMEELKLTSESLDVDMVSKCIDKILNSDFIYFYAAGNSIPIAMDAAYKFNLIGIRSNVDIVSEMQISSAYSLTENDVAFGISNSGTSKTVLKAFEIAKDRGAATICLTSGKKSPLANIADYKLFTVTNEELFFKEFSYTRVPALAVIDMLFLLVYKSIVNNAYKDMSIREEVLSDNKY